MSSNSNAGFSVFKKRAELKRLKSSLNGYKSYAFMKGLKVGGNIQKDESISFLKKPAESGILADNQLCQSGNHGEGQMRSLAAVQQLIPHFICSRIVARFVGQ